MTPNGITALPSRVSIAGMIVFQRPFPRPDRVGMAALEDEPTGAIVEYNSRFWTDDAAPKVVED